MNKAEMNSRVKNCMALVFGIENDAIDNKASMDNIETWDSLRHINLIIALEQEFGISFPDEEVAFLTSFELFCMAIYDAIGLNDE